MGHQLVIGSTGSKTSTNGSIGGSIGKKIQITRQFAKENDYEKEQQQLFKPKNSVHSQISTGNTSQLDQIPDDPTSESIIAKLKKKYLVFRPYEDPITLRPFQPPDRGYYFKLHKCDVKIIRYTLEDNGFREIP